MKEEQEEGQEVEDLLEEKTESPVLVFNRRRFVKTAFWICLLLFLAGIILGSKIIGG